MTKCCKRIQSFECIFVFKIDKNFDLEEVTHLCHFHNNIVKHLFPKEFKLFYKRIKNSIIEKPLGCVRSTSESLPLLLQISIHS